MPIIMTPDLLSNIELDIFDNLSNIAGSSGSSSTDGVGVEDLYASTESLLSDDIWKKFQFDFPDLNGLDDLFSDYEDISPDCCSLLASPVECEIRNHDCMWSGQCASKEHPPDDNRMGSLIPKFDSKVLPASPTFPLKPPAPPQKLPAPTSGRSLLLKPAARAMANTVTAAVSPDSPPMSDDEENKSKIAALVTNSRLFFPGSSLQQDIDDDSDLWEYLEEEDESEDVKIKVEVEDEDDDEEEEEEEEEEDEEEEEGDYEEKSRPRFAGEMDHCYFIKNSHTRVSHLGIDTPSDSEEEIDVVSVVPKHTNNRMVYSLPTNPSTRDRRHLQRRMASAMTVGKTTKQQQQQQQQQRRHPPIQSIQNKHHRTIEPVPTRRANVNGASATKGVKRGRRGAPSSPYKRRAVSNQTSDSEHEPSEKRSLHNNMERQRRIDLRNAFEDLRVLVPEVCNKEKAAKVVILREAAQYCYQLGTAQTNMLRHKSELKRQQEQLRARVSYLRRTLAAKR